MARPPQDAIETFMSITGASEAVALQKLEEHGADLNEAVNAYFNEGETINSRHTFVSATSNDIMDMGESINVEADGPPFSLLSASRNFNPFAVLDQDFGPTLFDRRETIDTASPRVSHSQEIRQIPIEFKDHNNQFSSSSFGPTVEDVTGSDTAVGPMIFGHVPVDEEDLPVAPCAPTSSQTDHLYGTVNDIEEEMIRAAIEASKQDAERYPNLPFAAPSVLSNGMFDQKTHFEDAEIERAVSLSLKTAEQERALSVQEIQIDQKQHGSSSGVKLDDKTRSTSNGRQELGASNSGTPLQFLSEDGNLSLEGEAEDVEEQALVRHHSRHAASEASDSTKEVVQLEDSSPSGPGTHVVGTCPQQNGDAFHSDEWGGLSSEEHDEAVMLEAAIFGGIPERAPYHFSHPSHQDVQAGSDIHSRFYPRIPYPPSPTLAAQRLLREQQDDEYLAALQADREKELKAMREAELRHLEAAAARETALQEEKNQEEEACRKLLEEEEFERELAAKQASLPGEPLLDDENAVTLLVRMPDGSRRGRRFLKSDKLQSLFDFIDVGRVVKPCTYKLVRPYPRCAFGDGECNLSLSELGLTSKQEALFLELI